MSDTPRTKCRAAFVNYNPDAKVYQPFSTGDFTVIGSSELAELEAQLAAAEKDVERWKERAEWQYAKHAYPKNPGLAVGALDATMAQGWTWKDKQAAIDEAMKDD